MANHFVRLPTMVHIVTLQRAQSSMGQLIGALARAEEFRNIMLRRCVVRVVVRWAGGGLGVCVGGRVPGQRWRCCLLAVVGRSAQL